MKVAGAISRKLSRFSPPILVYGAIYYFSSRPASSLPDIAPDYVSHFIEYAILGFFFMRMVLYDTKMTEVTLRPVLFSLPVMVLLALLDEVHQYYVPTRHFELKDILVDTVGILVGVGLYLYITQISHTTSTKINE